MSVIDWNKVFEYVIPIIVVLMAGLIALYRMRQNIELNDKLKRKEEFRNLFAEYLMALEDLYISVDVGKEKRTEKDWKEHGKLIFRITSLLESKFILMELMMAPEIRKNSKLRKCYIEHRNFLSEFIKKGEKATYVKIDTSEIYIEVQKIYDEFI